jgi:hypothetical protein
LTAAGQFIIIYAENGKSKEKTFKIKKGQAARQLEGRSR